MRNIKTFRRDARGNAMQTLALTAGAVALASLAGTHFLDRAVQTGAIQQVAGLRSAPPADLQRMMTGIPRPGQSSGEAPRESLRQVTVDYMPTGSIPANLAQPIILDPCTGMRK